jgi:hypothetical protein
MSTITVGMEVEATERHKRQFRFAKKPRDKGIVLSKSGYPKCWRVQWLGLANIETLHEDFIQPISGILVK